jgi:tRNA(adenine34) deaminase
MEEALVEARQALAAGEFPVGCVLVSGDTVIGRGHRCNSEGALSNEIDHAEVGTLRRLLADRPGTDCSTVTAYSTMEPCLMCYTTMLLSGIRRFVWAYEDVMGGGTPLPLDQLLPLYREMRVELVPGVMRQESLELFGRFFQKYTYWQGSLLEQYTLKQLKPPFPSSFEVSP